MYFLTTDLFVTRSFYIHLKYIEGNNFTQYQVKHVYNTELFFHQEFRNINLESDKHTY